MPSPPSVKRVLFVSQDPSRVDALRASLAEHGIEIVMSSTVDDIYRLLRTQHFDVIFTDIRRRRRVGTGIDLIHQLRSCELGIRNAAMPFVAMAPPSRDARDWSSFRTPLNCLARVSTSQSATTELLDKIDGLVTVPGLVDVNGQPLDSQKQALELLDIKFRAISDEAIKAFADDPTLLHSISPREFEELTAELFARNGFDVELTAQTRDGGADIFAAMHTELGQLFYVVECKRFSPKRPVGVELVRQLRAVVDRKRASCGVMVTTSTFTKGAHEEQRSAPYQLSLKDMDNIQAWMSGGPIFR